MVKKVKETQLNLYNFNAEDDKKKNQNKKKNKKKVKAKKHEIHDKAENNKFDFNDEIVIGLTRIEEKNDNSTESKKEKKKKSKSKKKHNNRKKEKNNKTKNTKKKRPIPKKKNKAKNRLNIKIIKYSFLIFCLVAIVIITMFSPLFNIKEIVVIGNEKITKDEIISLSQINMEENTYKVSKKKVKNRILENPYIKSIDVKRNLPSSIIITVEERKTTFMVEYGNSYAYVNNQGYILEISSQKLEVPILQGIETLVEEFIAGNRLCNEDLKKLSTVNKIMEMAHNNEIANLITKIDIQNSQNYKIIFENEKKVAYIGDEIDLNTKILSIKSILEREKDVAGEIFVNGDLKNSNPVFRQNV